MIKTMALVTALSVLIPVVIMSLIFGSQGDWDQIGSLFQIFVLVGLGLFVMFILIMLIVFGNRMNTRYSISQKGILQETIDKVGVAGSRLALLAGILGRSPGTAGAGLIAMSQQAVTLDWKGGFILDPRPRRHMLILRNGWRPVMEVYCTPENYAQVEVLVRQHMGRYRTETRHQRRSPLPRYLGHSALILLASFPIFAAYDEFGIDILVPMIMLAFALATLWLIPLFGYVVLLMNVLILAAFAGEMLEERSSMFRRGETYLHYEVFSEADWGNLILALLGIAYLSWLAWRAVRGKLMSLLVRDQEDMGS
jgi:hypothetical protein